MMISFIHKIPMFCVKTILSNLRFVFFMLLLGSYGILVADQCIYLPFYIRLFFELFLDIYLLCLFFICIPKRIRPFLKFIFSFFIYICFISDFFCLTYLDTTISPSLIQLLYETNSNEIENFASSYVEPELLLSPVGGVLFLGLLHLFSLGVHLNVRRHQYSLGILACFLLTVGMISSIRNKNYLFILFSAESVDDVECRLAHDNWVSRSLYTPVHRLFFSCYVNMLSMRQLDRLAEIYDEIHISKCQPLTKNVVLIIGESYNKHHSQLYGYQHETTPRQVIRAKQSDLYVFKDAVTPFNLTSDVFKNMFSTNDLSKHQSWTDYPLFTQVFHKAGYNVTFITNQYVKGQGNEFFDFSGGMFLNNAKIELTQFNHRNRYQYSDDIRLLQELDSIRRYEKENNLTIIHLMGQHFYYRNRFPYDAAVFSLSDYSRNDISEKEKQIIADYDNATRYNDYVVDEIIKRYERENAIVIYLADHGEECYDGLKVSGRVHSPMLSPLVVKNEFQIPLWIWCSKDFRENNKVIVSNISKAVQKPFFSDDLPHMLLSIGGIECNYYHSENDILNPNYKIGKKRLLRGVHDYSLIMRKRSIN